MDDITRRADKAFSVVVRWNRKHNWLSAGRAKFHSTATFQVLEITHFLHDFEENHTLTLRVVAPACIPRLNRLS